MTSEVCNSMKSLSLEPVYETRSEKVRYFTRMNYQQRPECTLLSHIFYTRFHLSK